MKTKAGDAEIVLVEGDITEMDTDAIVNAANNQLILGAGVAGAIRTKGGPTIQQECDKIGGTHVGGAVVTGAGNLKAKYVIHAVGPRVGEGNEDEKLTNAVKNSLSRANDHNMKSITFPAISTGIFGFPIGRAAVIMINTVKEHLSNPGSLEKVVFCLFGRESYDVFAGVFEETFEIIEV